MTNKNFMPPPLRQASTVILIRPKENFFEVYLLKRNTKSGFMGGLYVFPGGVIEPEDLDPDFWTSHIDLPLNQIKSHLGSAALSNEDTLGFSVAAIRETLEEAGVFMASDINKTKKDFTDICRFRLNRDLPKSWFRTKIKNDNWTLSFSSLGRWSHWITPELMKKRFDTRFFIALMPRHQTCVPDDMETKHGIWLTPQIALEKNLGAEIPLSPPTVVTLTQLLAFPTLDGLKREIQNCSWGDPVSPRLVPCTNGPLILEPWDPMFDKKSKIDTSNLSQKVLPPGSCFSRIWCDKGLWKPIGL